jgi:WD40 repeat protein
MKVDAKDLQKRFQPRAGKVQQVDRQLALIRFSPCGKFLVGGGYDAQVRRWETSADPYPDCPPLLGHHGWVQALAFHPDQKRLFSADSWGQLCCWPYAETNPKPLWTIPEAHDGWIRQLAVSPDGSTIASVGKDGMVRLWSPEGKKLREWSGAGPDIFSLAFHSAGKSLVTGNLRGEVKHWDQKGTLLRTLDASPMYLYHRIQDVGGVRCLLFDATGKRLVCGGGKPSSGASLQGTPLILVFDWNSGKVKHTLTLGTPREGFVYDVAWHPADFLMIVTSGQPGAGQFLFQRPEEAKPFFTHTRMQNCHSLAVHPGGQRLVVSATNRGSNGNGRRLTKDNEYPGNYSPLYPWEVASLTPQPPLPPRGEGEQRQNRGV